jgi:hypothetical protein
MPKVQLGFLFREAGYPKYLFTKKAMFVTKEIKCLISISSHWILAES